MSRPPRASGRTAPSGSDDVRPAFPTRPRLAAFVVATLAVGSVVAFISWMSRALAQFHAITHALNTEVTCRTNRPSQTVVVLIGIGLGCAAATAVTAFVVRIRARGRRRAPWTWLTAAGVVLLLAQGLMFLGQYSPDGSQASGGEFNATYCSAG